jgi:uncharacterized protein (TIGR00162 family)
MRKTTIFYNKKLKLKDPIMVVGLPGIGSVGSMVAEHIKNEMKAEKFASLYSPYFPHQAIMQRNGGLRLVNNRFYHFKNKEGRSIVLLVGDTQAGTPRGQYDVNEKIVRFMKKFNSKYIYTIGGYSAGPQYVQNPRVFGVATNKKTINELKKFGIIFGHASGSIWGSAGVIPAFSKLHDINSACIMGETGLLEIDANAAKAVLKVMMKLLSIDINLENIDKIKKETEKILKNLQEEQARAMSGEAGQAPSKENMTYIR